MMRFPKTQNPRCGGVGDATWMPSLIRAPARVSDAETVPRNAHLRERIATRRARI